MSNVLKPSASRARADLGTAAVLFLPAIVYLPALIGGVPFPSGESQFTDLLIAHYPYLLYLKQSLFIDHQIPLWFSTIYSGAPLAANPLAGLFYLPGWIAMLFPLPFGILLVSAGHSVFGAWGMFRLLQQLGVEKRSSLVGALCFGMMPKLAAHLGAGHISLLYALAWTPWLFAAYLKDHRGWLTGAAAGMLFLADPRWSVYAGLMFVPYAIAYRHYNLKQLSLYLLKAGVTAFLIGSPLILPMLEYLPLTTRSALDAKDIIKFGLPGSQLLGLFIPVSGGNVEWFFYPGGVVLALIAIQLFLPDHKKETYFWNYTLLISLLISMAFWSKGITWIQHLPVLSLLRVPARALFLVGFCAAIISGITLQHLVEMRERDKKVQRVGTIMLLFSGMLAAGIILITGTAQLQLIWGLGFLALGSIMILTAPGLLAGDNLFYAVSVLIVIDLLGAGWMNYQVRADFNGVDPYVLDVLNKDQSNFRIYSPSYSIAQGEAVLNSLEMASGVDPLQIATYRDFMERGSGVPVSGYSVSIPEFFSGRPVYDNVNFQPDSELLGLLNVKYLVSEFSIQDVDFEPIEINSPQYLYQNKKFLPRSWIERDGIFSQVNPAQIIKRTPNKIEVIAIGPGNLILSEVYYPGWKVLIDGKKAEITRAHQILRSVSISEGSHVVEFNYRPLSVISGLVLAGIGWVLIISNLIWKKS